MERRPPEHRQLRLRLPTSVISASFCDIDSRLPNFFTLDNIFILQYNHPFRILTTSRSLDSVPL